MNMEEYRKKLKEKGRQDALKGLHPQNTNWAYIEGYEEIRAKKNSPIPFKKITVKKGEDCPFYIWHDGGWCTYPRDKAAELDPYCAISSQPSPPCPMMEKGGLLIKLELDQETIDFVNKKGK